MFTSLNACQTNCIVPVTFDCDGQGNCADPGTGNGTYNSILDCQAECVSTSIPESELSNISIFPNPTDGLVAISFESIKNGDYTISILNVLSEIIFEEKLMDFSGLYQKKINLNKLAKSVYLIRIETSQSTINKKLILR